MPAEITDQDRERVRKARAENPYIVLEQLVADVREERDKEWFDGRGDKLEAELAAAKADLETRFQVGVNAKHAMQQLNLEEAKADTEMLDWLFLKIVDYGWSVRREGRLVTILDNNGQEVSASLNLRGAIYQAREGADDAKTSP